MKLSRRGLLAFSVAFVPAMALAAPSGTALPLLQDWMKLVLVLARHTPTYSPPYAARCFAYIGVTAYEAVASGSTGLISLAGQLDGLAPPPKRDPALTYDEGALLNAAMAQTVADFFVNTAPAGRRALNVVTEKQRARAVADVAPDVLERSEAFGAAIAAHVLAWSQTDNMPAMGTMGFPTDYTPPVGPEFWLPTNNITMQQKPLLPDWGQTRRFVASVKANCILPPPIAFSEEPGSAFYKDAMEVYQASMTMTDDQHELAMFWSDDPLLTSTPAGHGLDIAMQILALEGADLETSVDVIARVGVAQADAMTQAWAGKYVYNRIRPYTYIRRNIDPDWETLLITPPFPDYPSGHSVQAGALSAVLTQAFGENYAFTDHTGIADGMEPRNFPDFQAAAVEAGMSRLYGGIHYRNAIESGLVHGHAIGLEINKLKTRSA